MLDLVAYFLMGWAFGDIANKIAKTFRLNEDVMFVTAIISWIILVGFLGIFKGVVL